MNRKKNYFYKVIKLSGSSALSLVGISFYFVFASILDLLSIGLLGAYVAFIIDPKYISNELFIEIITIWQKFINSDHQIISVGILLCILFLFKSISSILLYKRIIQFSHIKQAQLRTTLMSIYKRMNYLSYIKRDTSEHVTSMGSMVKNFGNSLQATLQCAGDIIVTLAIITFLLFINGPMLITLIVFLSFLVFAYKFFFLNNLSLFGKRLNAGYQKMYQGVQEYFIAFKELKVLNSFFYFEKKIIDSSKEIAHSDIRQSVITTIPRFILEFVLVLFIVSIITITIFGGGDLLALIPTLSIFAAASLRLAPITYQFTKYIGTFRYTKDSIDKLYSDLFSDDIQLSSSSTTKYILKSDKFKKLELKALNFAYDENKPILENISLTLNIGDAVGIVGESGSGKTTLINLILGLIKPQKGQILSNGKDIHEDISSWRLSVAYVPQEIFLINDSILSNVALGLDNKLIDKKKVELSLKKAQIMDFLKSSKNGIDAVVGERGVTLSGGQRQRIAIARAFYYDRDILILDEPTSSIDSKTGKEIISYLNELKKEKTIIIISHNADAINFCDKIYRLDSRTLQEIN